MSRSKKKQSKPAVEPTTPASSAPSKATESQPKTVGRSMRILTGCLAVVIIVALLMIIGYFVYEYRYTDKIYPGVSIAGQDMSGMNFQSANQLITEYQTTLSEQGLQFTYQDNTITIPVDITVEATTTNEEGEPTEATETISLIEINSAETIQAAFAVGRTANAADNAGQKLSALTTGKSLPLIYTMNRASLLEQLKAEFEQYTTPYQDAALVASEDGVTVTPSTNGNDFDWEAILGEIETKINHLETVELVLTLESQAAPITTAEADAEISEAEAVLAAAPLQLTYEDNTYTIERDELATWLTVSDLDQQSQLTFDEDAVRTSLATVAGEIDVPVQEGKFSLDIVDGVVKLTQFSDGEDGLGVNVEAAIADLQQTVLRNHESNITLSVEVTHPRANPETLEDLGITELLGTGTTNFSGSPSNRILNIKKGADLLNGLLIAPGETFSLLDVLKPIDIEHGWYSELVIKGDKLEKEAGGGLCQVGSTAFRAAMLSGLPIVERRNHSWAISYYAYKGKAGVDATIYDPSPDFKFKNDTDHYILWRSRIEGSDIYFELWGTSDGRKGSFTDPINYNYVSPGPTVETVDPTLAPGTRNCDGHAFTGVSASFDYIVEHADGTTETETFTSVYKARPQLCLVGPDAPAETTTEDTTTDTNTNTNTDTTNTNTNTNSNTNTNTNTGKNKNKNN